MYISSLEYERTPKEFKDQKLSWNRTDEAFFASGACHVLAFTLKGMLSDPAYKIVFIKPAGEFGSTGTHVYVTDGVNAFDFNGWSKESELLDETKKSYQSKYPSWTFEKVVVESDIAEFCKKNQHRPPSEFAGDAVGRAKNFIERKGLRFY